MINFHELKEPYLIGEIGINHNGDMQIAKRLIDALFASEWHCVKFQKRNPDVCVPEHQKKVMRDTPWGKMTYLEYKHKIEFGQNEYEYIDRYCKEKPLDWSASVWDLNSLSFISQFDVPFIKIPSAMLTNIPLIRAAAKTKKQLAISTGMSTIEEIDRAVEIFKEESNETLVIMHSNSSYPAPHNELNLNVIITLRERYPDCVIGYSGHEEDLEPTVAAIVLGARVIERHITLSHDMWGTDHRSSLQVPGISILKKRTQCIDIILGSFEKTVTRSEIPVREKLRGKI
jgi:N-acetylneuraminate synthase